MVEPVTGRSVTLKVAVERGRRAAVVEDVGGDGVGARLGVGVAAVDVERAGRLTAVADEVPMLFGEPSPQSMVAVKSVVGAAGLASVKVPTTVP